MVLGLLENLYLVVWLNLNHKNIAIFIGVTSFINY
jgi:hypothetical protein